MAPIIYRPEAKEIAKQLWDETMTELSFAHLEDVIEEVVSQIDMMDYYDNGIQKDFLAHRFERAVGAIQLPYKFLRSQPI